MNKLLLIFASAVLFLSSAATIFGQYQGCVSSEGESRFAFQFHPIVPKSSRTENSSASVRVKPNEKIAFVLSRIDQNYTEADVDNVQRAAPYEFLDPLRNITIPTDNLYALVESVGINYEYTPQGEKYVFPVDFPQDNTEINGKKIRLLKFNVNRELEFDTTGMSEGFYWVTLQGKATFSNQTTETCDKTTPPVLIEIKYIPPPTPTPTLYPTVTLKIEGSACEPRTLSAVAEDKDNLPNSGLPRQTLTLDWEIKDDDGKEINFQKTSIGNLTDARYTEEIKLSNLKLGNYSVKVTVSDGKYTADKYDKFLVRCRGAGIVYFQFDEPYKTRASLLDPEGWVGNYNRRNQCGDEIYPESEFDLFYGLTAISLPPIRKSNTNKLREIVETLNNNPTYKLHITGYADFRASAVYNTDLVNRRLGVVKDYLRSQGINVDRITEETVNFSDFKAQSCFADACDISRKHDRRVELIYYTTGDKPPLPNYKDSPCSSNANLFINPIYENDLEILADE